MICEHARTNDRVSTGSSRLDPTTESAKTTCLSPSNTTPRAREPFSSFCPGRFNDNVGSGSFRLFEARGEVDGRDFVLNNPKPPSLSLGGCWSAAKSLEVGEPGVKTASNFPSNNEGLCLCPFTGGGLTTGSSFFRPNTLVINEGMS
jgi:hypothetical protein